MPNDKLYGEDATIARVLEKIELAAHRTGEALVGTSHPVRHFEQFAFQLQRIVKDMYNAK